MSDKSIKELKREKLRLEIKALRRDKWMYPLNLALTLGLIVVGLFLLWSI